MYLLTELRFVSPDGFGEQKSEFFGQFAVVVDQNEGHARPIDRLVVPALARIVPVRPFVRLAFVLPVLWTLAELVRGSWLMGLSK